MVRCTSRGRHNLSTQLVPTRDNLQHTFDTQSTPRHDLPRTAARCCDWLWTFARREYLPDSSQRMADLRNSGRADPFTDTGTRRMVGFNRHRRSLSLLETPLVMVKGNCTAFLQLDAEVSLKSWTHAISNTYPSGEKMSRLKKWEIKGSCYIPNVAKIP